MGNMAHSLSVLYQNKFPREKSSRRLYIYDALLFSCLSVNRFALYPLHLHFFEIKTHFCLPTKVHFLNDVCLWQMMFASPMMMASPNDVCLRAHKGKYRIIASETSNIILSEAKNIISPQAMLH